MKQIEKNSLLILACVIIFTLFFGIGGVPLLDPDEPVYAETAREMIQTGDFLSPRIFGDYWYDKPPMYYWLVAAAFKVFGYSEFAARFPAALMGALTAFMLYFSVTKLFNVFNSYQLYSVLLSQQGGRDRYVAAVFYDRCAAELYA